MNQPPIDYAVCTGARIIRNALRHLLKRISEGHGTPAETFALLWDAREAAWKETLELMDPENHEENYPEVA
jgi:hypothetical protein